MQFTMLQLVIECEFYYFVFPENGVPRVEHITIRRLFHFNLGARGALRLITERMATFSWFLILFRLAWRIEYQGYPCIPRQYEPMQVLHCKNKFILRRAKRWHL